MKKRLLVFILMILIMFSGCSREIHVYCDCAEAIADIQLSDTQAVTTDSTVVETNDEMPVSDLQFAMMEVLCDMYWGGWSYLDTVKGEIDTEKYFSGVELVPTKLLKYEELYSMIAIYPHNDIYVVVKIVHYTPTDDAKIVERYYANSEGKVFRDEYLQNFLLGYPMYENRIIPTSEYGLSEYFKSNNETTEANDIDLNSDELTETTDEQTNETEPAEKSENSETADVITKERIDTDLWIAQNKIVHEVAPVFVQGNMKVYSAKKALEELPFSFDSQPKYRDIYYREPSFLYDLVTSEEWNEWCTDVLVPDRANNTQPDEPYVLNFVKRFQIEKKDFIECVAKLRERQVRLHGLKSDEYPDERYELHNADVIYTFDTEFINNYYLRDQIGIKQTD